MRFRSIALTASLLALHATAFAAATQTPLRFDAPEASDLKRMTLEELSQIDISSVSKEPRRAFRTPAAIYVMTQDEIRRSGATNIPDILRLIPGVQVAQIDSVQYAVGIRGFQGRLSRSVLVLIDGRSVYTPLFAGVYWEMQDTLIEDIDRIEVIRGPGGTVWGANAVNGVINIITKSARDTRGMLVSAGGGNVEQGFLNWRYGAGDDKLSYRIYGKGFTRGPQFHPDGRNFDDWRMGQVGFRMDWAKNQRDTVTVQGDAYAAAAGSKVNISSFTPPAVEALEANASLYGQNVLARWRRVYDSGANLQVQTYYDRTDRQDLNYKEVRHTFDMDLAHQLPMNRHRIRWGLGARISPSEFEQTTPTVDFIPRRQTYNIFSGFLEDEYALVPERLSLTAGAKIQHNTFSGFEVQPGAQLSWTPSRAQTIWAAFTRAVRTPSRLEHDLRLSALTDPAIPLFARVVGDGEFSSEHLLGYELGYRRYFQTGGFLAVSTFLNRYDDLLSIESRPLITETDTSTGLILPLEFRNGVRAQTSGGEVSGLWDLRRWWRVTGSYSLALLDARNKPESNDASTVGQLEGNSSRHKVAAQSSFELPRRFELNLMFRHVSGVTNQAIPSYSTGDAWLAWRLHPQLELSIVGRNLLQPSHVEYSDNPGPLAAIRRSAYVKLTWTR